jgi:homoserine O-acetyltransferase/O-succinyltransferase
MLLDDIGVRQIAVVIGGSLGGMFTLEWAYLGKEYVRCVVAIATSSRHSAWGISWGESQRQAIYSDSRYLDGYYDLKDPPLTGLGAARMSALLTYRSRNSFESRFGRNTPDPSKRQTIRELPLPTTPREAHFHIHNDGHKIKNLSRHNSYTGKENGNGLGKGTRSNSPSVSSVTSAGPASPDPQFRGPQKESLTGGEKQPMSHYFSAQSYLRYQGEKFVKRFDSNCYIAMTRKLDTHDVSRDRADTISEALAQIQQPTLILGIESDGLFTFAEQEELAEFIQDARLGRIDSPEGHDAFLLQFEQVNRYILDFLNEVLPDIMTRDVSIPTGDGSVAELTKTSVFGEAEVGDITAW